jgi:uncharacterized membrane protein
MGGQQLHGYSAVQILSPLRESCSLFIESLVNPIIMAEDNNKKSGFYIAMGVALGAAFGAAYGSYSGNISMGVAMGAVIGVLCGVMFGVFRSRK